ncbi:MAG: hypothetical protein S0880_24835 [Actinomycetota bacterium]|nr:hypothetical protein [Actinomycetota bacterium]
MADHDLDHRDDTGTDDAATDATRRDEHGAVDDAIEYFSPDSPPETGDEGRKIAYPPGEADEDLGD